MRQGQPLTVVSPGVQKPDVTHVSGMVNGLLIVGENGYGDEFGIGSDEAFTVLEVANLFGVGLEMLPERKGNRLTAEVITDKTRSIGWSCCR